MTSVSRNTTKSIFESGLDSKGDSRCLCSFSILVFLHSTTPFLESDRVEIFLKAIHILTFAYDKKTLTEYVFLPKFL